jgi:branched-chain amino acid transport system permease protein
MADFIQIAISGLSQGAVYGLMALGLTVIYRSTTVLNFAHGAFFALGAFATLYLLEFEIPYVLAIALAVALVFVLGIAVFRLAFGRLLTEEHFTQVFATVAVSFIATGILRAFSADQRGMPTLFGGGMLRVGEVSINPQHLVSVTTLLLVSGAFAWVFLRTRFGRILRASTQNLRGATLVGINVTGVFATMWGIGSGLAALAGILAAPTLLVSADVGVRPFLLGFAAMSLGGFGSFPGAVVGGLLIGLIEVFAGFYISTTLGNAAGFLVILLVLLVRPQGIFGSGEVDD